MSKAKARKGEDEVHEIFEIDPTRIDGVSQPAHRSGAFLLVKAVAPETSFGRNAGRRLSPKAREAFSRNAQRVRAGKRPKKGKADKRRRGAQPVVAVKAMSGYSSEIPATGCANESASILASVTNERSGGLCSARTMSGTPCQRPAVNGGMCHHHA